MSASKDGRRRLRVALLVETSLASGRDIISGIARFVREHRQWALYHEPRSLEELALAPRLLRNWEGDGIIARIQSRRLLNAVKKLGVPTVDVLGLLPSPGIPCVHVDDNAIAELAAEHFQERGFRHFAFVGIAGENWSQGRRDAFRLQAKLCGNTLEIFEFPRHRIEDQREWEHEETQLAAWVSSLPKPVGIFVCSDQRGPALLEACQRARVAVPEEVAVLGVDNDEPLCEVCEPPLSSIDPGHQAVGYEAARLLHRWLEGEGPPAAPVRLRLQDVKVRLSTDVQAIGDPATVQALHYIREHVAEKIAVDDVAKAAFVSRSVLQRRFRQHLGSSIHDQILSARIKRARKLLTETDLSFADVAERSGFRFQEYFSKVFKEQTRMTPAQYRIRFCIP